MSEGYEVLQTKNITFLHVFKSSISTYFRTSVEALIYSFLGIDEKSRKFQKMQKS